MASPIILQFLALFSLILVAIADICPEGMPNEEYQKEKLSCIVDNHKKAFAAEECAMLAVGIMYKEGKYTKMSGEEYRKYFPQLPEEPMTKLVDKCGRLKKKTTKLSESIMGNGFSLCVNSIVEQWCADKDAN